MTSLHGSLRLLLLTITGCVAVTSYAQQPPDVVQSDKNGNTAMGTAALQSNTTGYANTAVGFASLNANTSGYANTAVGYSALNSNTTGTSNTAVGQNALNANTIGIANTVPRPQESGANVDQFAMRPGDSTTVSVGS